MKSMKYLDGLNSINAYFAFTSNNMHDIEGHTNTVNSIDEFIQQMPTNAKILHQDEIKDSRGTRYLLTENFLLHTSGLFTYTCLNHLLC